MLIILHTSTSPHLFFIGPVAAMRLVYSWNDLQNRTLEWAILIAIQYKFSTNFMTFFLTDKDPNKCRLWPNFTSNCYLPIGNTRYGNTHTNSPLRYTFGPNSFSIVASLEWWGDPKFPFLAMCTAPDPLISMFKRLIQTKYKPSAPS